MAVAPIQHVTEALGRLVSQYQNSPRVVALVTALAMRDQVIEDAIAKTAGSRFLTDGSAMGAQLDAIGQLIGADRNGLDDATYRIMIRGKIAANTSNGTLDDVLNIAKTLFAAKAVYATTPNSSGHSRNYAFAELSLAIGSPGTDPSLEPRILKLITAALPAGVVLVSLCYFDADAALACDGPQPWVAPFSDLNGQGGGKLANVIESNLYA